MTTTMLSRLFQKAIDQEIKQIKGMLSDGKGGYCATGWLQQNGIETHEGIFRLWERWLDNEYPTLPSRGLRIVAYLNDVKNWNWKRFRKAAVRFEKIIDAKQDDKQ